MTVTVELCVDYQPRFRPTVFGLFARATVHTAGAWMLTTPNADIPDPIAAGIDSIRVFDDGREIYAGRVAYPDDSGSLTAGVTRTIERSGRFLQFDGADVYGAHLATRVAYPNPNTNPPWNVAYDTRTGPASTVAAQYIQANLGNVALTARRDTNLIVLNPTPIGVSGTWQARLQSLAHLVGQICEEGGIVCDATIDSLDRPQFAFRTPTDRTGSVVFTDTIDVDTMTAVTRPASATYVIAAGQGELEARSFATAGGGTGRTRVERLHEDTTAETTAGLARAASTVLADNTAAVYADPQLATSESYRYGRDYYLGDTVTLTLGGIDYPVIVYGVEIDITVERDRVVPILGTAPRDGEALRIRQLRDIADRQARTLD